MSNPSTELSSNMSSTSENSVERAVVAVFDDRINAEYAVDALEQVGFTHDHIGYVIRGADVSAGGMLTIADGAKDMRGAAAGIITGGIVGGVLATAAAILIPPIGPVIAAGLLASFFGGTIAGMAIGGIIGALKARRQRRRGAFYEKKFHEGKAIVAVKTGPRAAEAAIF